jgi:ubiquinone/menaquinone biosynthesis C-methylase UbiE
MEDPPLRAKRQRVSSAVMENSAMSQSYRWNQSELAAAYDRDAPLVHPHYASVQDVVLELIAPAIESGGTVLDLGAGSGRLVERILERFPGTRAVLVDQSEAFLELARRRLVSQAGRVDFVHGRLQEEWSDCIPEHVNAIVSMSAIHHLEPDEKQRCYGEAWKALRPGGVFANGDEVRAESDEQYHMQCAAWGRHMQRLVDEALVSAPMAGALAAWQSRNIQGASAPRRSGDDCHETVERQLEYLREAGFEDVFAAWSRDLWTVLTARRR